MDYFYTNLFFQFIIYIFMFNVLIKILRFLLKNTKKNYIISFMISISVITSIFYLITLPEIRDIEFVKNQELLSCEGKIKKTYSTLWVCSLVLNDGNYIYNPRQFSPIENRTYKIYYLPNSKFIVRYEQ